MNSEKDLWVLGHKITPINNSGDFDAVIGESKPGIAGPPPHFHNKFTELFFMLEGEIEFIINGKTRIAKPGDYIDLPPHTVHTYKNRSDSISRWLNIHSPRGFLSFYNEVGFDTVSAHGFENSVSEFIITKVFTRAKHYDMNFAAEPA